jgi:hypothetical protein
LQAIEKITLANSWITGIFLFLFLSIVLLKLLDSKRLKESFFTFFNLSFLEDEDIEPTNFFDPFQIVIFFFSVVVLSLLTHKAILFKIVNFQNTFSTFLEVFIALFIYFLAKRILEYFLSLLFLIKKGIHFFLTSKYNYLYSLSFLTYIALILNEYATINELYIFYFIGFLFIIRFIFFAIRNKKLIFNKLFYFILYICAFEIAPLFVLSKLMF